MSANTSIGRNIDERCIVVYKDKYVRYRFFGRLYFGIFIQLFTVFCRSSNNP